MQLALDSLSTLRKYVYFSFVLLLFSSKYIIKQNTSCWEKNTKKK